jgi:hypothetical protein
MQNSNIVTNPTVTDNVVAVFLILAFLALVAAIAYAYRHAGSNNRPNHTTSPLRQVSSCNRGLALDGYTPAPPPLIYCGAKLPRDDDEAMSPRIVSGR